MGYRRGARERVEIDPGMKPAAAEARAHLREMLSVRDVSFVTRCLSTWIAAGGLPAGFFSRWLPVPVPNPTVRQRDGSGTRGAHTARRGTHSVRRRHTSRSNAGGGAASPASTTSAAELLERRYPYVAALLVELSAVSRRSAAG
jgi:hypothetical protein